MLVLRSAPLEAMQPAASGMRRVTHTPTTACPQCHCAPHAATCTPRPHPGPHLRPLADALLVQLPCPAVHLRPQLCLVGAPRLPHLRQRRGGGVQDAALPRL